MVTGFAKVLPFCPCSSIVTCAPELPPPRLIAISSFAAEELFCWGRLMTSSGVVDPVDWFVLEAAVLEAAPRLMTISAPLAVPVDELFPGSRLMVNSGVVDAFEEL